MMNAFVAVVDGNGFARAARKLDVSPPVVTRAVSELETRLGFRLLNRTTRVVRIASGAHFPGPGHRPPARRPTAALSTGQSVV